MFQIEIYSPEGMIFGGTVEEAVFPTEYGEITVLSNHVSIFSKLLDGQIHINSKGKTTNIAITGGFLEVKEGTVTVLSNYAIKAENIQVARAQAAKKRAEDLMKNKKSQVDFLLAERELKKSILELKVAGKLKKQTIIS